MQSGEGEHKKEKQMTLRGVKPTAVQKRLKAFLFGPAGSGKTWASIHFPGCYLIDTERGAENDQYARILEQRGGAYLHTSDLDEIIEEVRVLATEPHPYRTLVIDPCTVPYANAVDASALKKSAEDKTGQSDGTEFGRHKIQPDRAMRRLLALCYQLDMNVLMTAHMKALWGKVNGKQEQIGTTFDAWGKSDYLFDLVLEIEARGRESRYALVRKSRIEAFPLGDQFEFSYDEVAERYGRDILERATGVIELAGEDQVQRIEHLIHVLKIEDEITQKWFQKANTDQFAEFSKDAADKVLGWLEARLNPTPTLVPKEAPAKEADSEVHAA